MPACRFAVSHAGQRQNLCIRSRLQVECVRPELAFQMPAPCRSTPVCRSILQDNELSVGERGDNDMRPSCHGRSNGRSCEWTCTAFVCFLSCTERIWGSTGGLADPPSSQPPCLDDDFCFISTRLPVRLWLGLRLRFAGRGGESARLCMHAEREMLPCSLARNRNRTLKP